MVLRVAAPTPGRGSVGPFGTADGPRRFSQLRRALTLVARRYIAFELAAGLAALLLSDVALLGEIGRFLQWTPSSTLTAMTSVSASGLVLVHLAWPVVSQLWASPA